MQRVGGKVAFITGAARGQGRSHAIRLAEEGADIIAIDICGDDGTGLFPMASETDLGETVKQVEARGRGIVAGKADVRDLGSLQAVLTEGVDRFGRLDIVCANAAICTIQPWDETTDVIWDTTIAINLKGAWHTFRAAAPYLIEGGGGSMIAIGSTSGMKGHPWALPYVAAKHGLVGITKALANELGKHSIRVNAVHPAGVNTPMGDFVHPMVERLVAQDPDLGTMFANSLPATIMEPRDVSEAVVFLASDESRYVTGLQLPVDFGNGAR